MLLLEMMIAVLRQAEHGRAVFNRAWDGPPVSCPMLPHGLNQIEHHLAVRTGALLFTGWRMVDLQVLDQGLFGVIPFTTCLAIVQELLTTTGGPMHVHHATACQMFPTFLTYVVCFTSQPTRKTGRSPVNATTSRYDPHCAETPFATKGRSTTLQGAEEEKTSTWHCWEEDSSGEKKRKTLEAQHRYSGQDAHQTG